MTNGNAIDILDFIWCAGFLWALLIVIREIFALDSERRERPGPLSA